MNPSRPGIPLPEAAWTVTLHVHATGRSLEAATRAGRPAHGKGLVHQLAHRDAGAQGAGLGYPELLIGPRFLDGELLGLGRLLGQLGVHVNGPARLLAREDVTARTGKPVAVGCGHRTASLVGGHSGHIDRSNGNSLVDTRSVHNLVDAEHCSGEQCDDDEHDDSEGRPPGSGKRRRLDVRGGIRGRAVEGAGMPQAGRRRPRRTPVGPRRSCRRPRCRGPVASRGPATRHHGPRASLEQAPPSADAPHRPSSTQSRRGRARARRR